MSQIHHLARQFASGTWDAGRPIFVEWCRRHGIDAAALPDLSHCLRLVVEQGDTFLHARVTDAEGHHTGSLIVHLKDEWFQMRGTIGSGVISLASPPGCPSGQPVMLAASLPAALQYLDGAPLAPSETVLAVPSPATLHGAAAALPLPPFVLANSYTAVAHAVEKLAAENHLAAVFLLPGLQKHIDFIRSGTGPRPAGPGFSSPSVNRASRVVDGGPDGVPASTEPKATAGRGAETDEPAARPADDASSLAGRDRAGEA